MKNFTRNQTRCPICDEWYDERGDRARIHEHPEPQSGIFRNEWLSSLLPYDQWVLTDDGQRWVARANKSPKPLA